MFKGELIGEFDNARKLFVPSSVRGLCCCGDESDDIELDIVLDIVLGKRLLKREFDNWRKLATGEFGSEGIGRKLFVEGFVRVRRSLKGEADNARKPITGEFGIGIAWNLFVVGSARKFCIWDGETEGLLSGEFNNVRRFSTGEIGSGVFVRNVFEAFKVVNLRRFCCWGGSLRNSVSSLDTK